MIAWEDPCCIVQQCAELLYTSTVLSPKWQPWMAEQTPDGRLRHTWNKDYALKLATTHHWSFLNAFIPEVFDPFALENSLRFWAPKNNNIWTHFVHVFCGFCVCTIAVNNSIHTFRYFDAVEAFHCTTNSAHFSTDVVCRENTFFLCLRAVTSRPLSADYNSTHIALVVTQSTTELLDTLRVKMGNPCRLKSWQC